MRLMNNEHIQITGIVRFAIRSPLLSTENREEIQLHINECFDCKKQFNEINKAYNEIQGSTKNC